MSAQPDFQPGSIVRARGREWVVLPETEGQQLHLRSLGGADEDVTVLYAPLEKEPVEPASFPWPDPARAGQGTQTGALLMRDALLLKLRAGAGPFRALGRINVEPRAYQLVPLLMALKHDVIRLLIADDVGIGKTIEAGLIARELLDRGEIQRMAVLCPPHLCEQWQEELQRKFNINAELVTTGTVARLERHLEPHTSVFTEYPFTVVSLDYIKSDRRRDEFQHSCPEFVIVDEAHTCTRSGDRGRQQRYTLLRDLADNPARHLVMLTATPHSGNEEAYFNLLGLLDRDFQQLKEIGGADHPLYKRLGDHLVQRRRIDIKDWQDNTRFPDREVAESSYQLTGDWGKLFNSVLRYARELVAEAEGESTLHQRLNWWAALALLRCISSSPAAARRALQTRLQRAVGEAGNAAELSVEEQLEELEAAGETAVLDGAPEAGLSADDVEPGAVLQENEAHLQSLLKQVDRLTNENDPKLQHLITQLKKLTKEGFRPVIFCRYIATAHYVAEALGGLFKKHEVLCVTGELNPAEREEKVHALRDSDKPGLMVATDCLSEGINLQEFFDAAIHYDLSWNPTRHEQREGRVDRFGQRAPRVRALMIYGQDNPVDGTVLQVILRKAEKIRKALGISVPMPEDENKVTEAIMQTVLLTKDGGSGLRQMGLDLQHADQEQLEADLDEQWESARERETANRTRFAQRALKPEEVLPEFERTRDVLGDASDVQRFVLCACRELEATPALKKDIYQLPFQHLPEAVRDRVAFAGVEHLRHIDFDYPPRNNAEYIHRTHPLVAALADQITEQGLDSSKDGGACRAAAWFSPAVEIRTTVLLLRLRSQLRIRRNDTTRELIAEEAVAVAITGREAPRLLAPADTLSLMSTTPSRNMTPEMRQRQVVDVLDQLQGWQPALEEIAHQRARDLLEDHRRVRKAARARGNDEVIPQLPVDIIGAYVLLPNPSL